MTDVPVSIGGIENAMIARLVDAATSGALGYVWRLAESYPDDWEAYLGKVNVRGPAFWVTFAGWDRAWQTDTGNLRIENAMFGITVCAESKRNERASRHGAAGPGEIGSYQLLLDAALLLSGSSLGLDIDRLRPGPARAVAMPSDKQAQGLSFFAMPFMTDFEIEPVEGDSISPFEILHANWDIPPFGTGPAGAIDRGNLPDDFRADATDIIHLEQPE
jgi:phage gp37-like protein